jgi:hypothetical protein
MAGDSHTNLVESVHRDANREGIQCTLLGGLQKGQAFDSLKMRTLEVTSAIPFPFPNVCRAFQMYETYGIPSTYRSGHLSENNFRNLRRRGEESTILVSQRLTNWTWDNTQQHKLLLADQKIKTLNRKLQNSYDSLCKARQNILKRIQNNLARHDISEQVSRLIKSADKALELAYKTGWGRTSIGGFRNRNCFFTSFRSQYIVYNKLAFWTQ